MKYSHLRNSLFTTLLVVLFPLQFLAFIPTSHQLISAPTSGIRHTQALRLMEYFLRTNTDSLWNNAMYMNKISKELEDREGVLVSKWMFGNYFIKKGQATIGIDFLKEVKYYYVSRGDFEKVCKLLNDIGIGYFLQGDYATAEEHYKASLRAGDETVNPSLSILAEVNLAKLYIQQKKLEKAQALLDHYINEAKRLKKFESVANAYGVKADIYLSKHKLEIASEFCEKQWKYALLSNSVQQKVNALTNKGIIAFTNDDFKAALKCFMDVLELRKKEHFPHRMYEAYYNMAAVYLEIDNQLSFSYIDSAQQIAHQYGLLVSEREALLYKRNDLNLLINENQLKNLEQTIALLEEQNKEERDAVVLTLKDMKVREQKTTWHSSLYWWIVAVFMLSIIPFCLKRL
jgi:tetratricopeptide (TPR) repeat protein